MIYYIGCAETNRVKIGYTKNNPYARLSALQTGSPTQLSFMAMHEGDQNTERRLHERFAEYRHHGEWFEASEEVVKYMFGLIWVSARALKEKGQPYPDWIQVGLDAMLEDLELPEDLVGLV